MQDRGRRVCRAAVITYTPAADLTDGRTDGGGHRQAGRRQGRPRLQLVLHRGQEPAIRLYFGQLHAHTQYSDGSGTLDSALDYVANLPDSANVDFVAFTDHSNYFDSKTNRQRGGRPVRHHSGEGFRRQPQLEPPTRSTIDAFNAREYRRGGSGRL